MELLKWLLGVFCLITIGVGGAFGGAIGALLACILLVLAIVAVVLLCIAQGRKVF